MISVLIFIVLSAALFAVLEIQIEGADGWAKNLPCWRLSSDGKTGKFFSRSLKKEITGYHLSIIAVVCLFFHAGFFFGIPWSFSREMNVMASNVLFWILEDFLWFAFNPAFGLKKFRPGNIPWYKDWWGPLPKEYYFLFAIAIVLYII